MTRARVGLALLLLAGCYTPERTVTLRLELPPELAEQAHDVEVQPHIAELARRAERGVLALRLKQRAGKVELRLSGACPLRVDTRALPEAGVTSLTLAPLFELGPRERVVGLGQPFTLQARPGCAAAQQAAASFRFLGGAPLERLEQSQQGRRLDARTRSAAPEHRAASGVVAVSAREQQRLRSELSFRAELPGGLVFERLLGVSAVARSTGLSEVGLGHPVLLAGAGFRLLATPAGSHATLRTAGELQELTPDVPGHYRLESAAGQSVAIESARYDRMPLDCGRSDCHADIAQSAQHSPMTQVLASDLGGCHALDHPACALACHATGEPGTSDGGFSQVLAELALPALPAEHDDLPRALKRLGGVGCLACHGPSRIPAPGEQLALLRSDVCAVCHDAPPRYGHVAALAASRMGHADASPEVRARPACARCHTSWGALGAATPSPLPEPAGITCAVCHDVHPHPRKPTRAASQAAPATSSEASGSEPIQSLLRRLSLPPTLPEPPASFLGPSRVCIGCHAPSSRTLRPEASAALLVAGQGGLEPATGAPLAAPAPHAQSPRGCLSCHDSGPQGLELGKSHGFRASAAACRGCHDSAPPRDPSMAQRAQSLLARLDPEHSRADAQQPFHARYQLLLLTPQATRALRDVLLVLEDPAADVHHPAYAKALLDAAERFVTGARP